jgi:hypothetical protein
MLRRSHVKLPGGSGEATGIELLGFRYARSFLSELEAIDLLTLHKAGAQRALIMQSHGEPNLHDLMSRMRSVNCEVELQRLNTPRMWLWEENFGRTLVPYHALRAMVSWLSRVCP